MGTRILHAHQSEYNNNNNSIPSTVAVSLLNYLVFIAMPNNNTYCSVFGCKSIGNDRTKSFHLFPTPGRRHVLVTNKFGEVEKVDQRLAWERALKMGKKVSNRMTVCSLHFSKDCYILPDYPTKKRRLKCNAIPDQNLPELPKRGTRLKRSKKRRILQKTSENQQHECPREEEGSKSLNEEDGMPVEDASKTVLTADLGNLIDEVVNNVSADLPQQELQSWRSIAVQVKSGDIYTPFIAFVSSDAVVNTLTGIQTIGMFEMIVRFFSMKMKPKRTRKLSAKERVLMTLMKLKLNISFQLLEILFQCVGSTCRLVFEETLVYLSGSLSHFILLPSREETLQNLPKCFVNFKNCRMVMDCTEVFVQKPKCLNCRIKLYSQNKGGLTVKFLTGVTPSGVICFISKPYGGGSSDTAIFEQSNVVDMLESGDELMVDKGFLIDEICEVSKIQLIRPPFLHGKQQLSKEEALASREIAAARAHIERSNQRLRLFKFFKSEIEWSFSHLLHDAFIVVCALTNLSPPMRDSDKF